MELADAASQLRAELSLVTVHMSDFGRQTKQQLAEAISGVEENMLASVRQGTGSLATMAKQAEDGIAQSFGDLKKRAQTLDSAVGKIVDSIDEHGATTARLATAMDAMGPRIELLFKAGEQIEKASTALEKQAVNSASLHQAIMASASEVRTAVAEQAGLVNSMKDNLSSIASTLDARLTAIEGTPVTSAGRIASMINSIGTAAGQQVEQFASAHASALQSHLRTLDETLSVTKAHNAELAAELEKARGYTTRVHGSLVEFTDELTRQVEAKAAAGSAA